MQSNYSPFEIQLDDLSANDLLVLRDVHEGWYVEYKSEMVNSSSIAKAVSAFANTYGGWLFIGVCEDSKDNNVAGEFPGIPIDQKDKIRQKIRSSLSANVNPTPHFDLKFLEGPEPSVGLSADKTILIVQVPQSAQAPHVHKDGRIYKRVSDSSEPKPEADPHLLSQLWRRREKADELIKKWVETNPEFSKHESKNPYLRVLLTPDDWGQSKINLDASITQVREVLRGDSSKNFHMPLDAIFRNATGYVARQVGTNDVSNYGVTLKVDRNLNCDFILPLMSHDRDMEELRLYLQEYKNADNFVDIFQRESRSVSIIDMNFLFPALGGLVAKYRDLMRLSGKEVSFYAKVVLLNAWRHVPFLDDKDYMRQIENDGSPMVMKDLGISPTGSGAGSFMKIPGYWDDEKVNELTKLAMPAFAITRMVLELMGVDVFFDDERDAIDIENLLDAGKRASRNQQHVTDLTKDPKIW